MSLVARTLFLLALLATPACGRTSVALHKEDPPGRKDVAAPPTLHAEAEAKLASLVRP